MRRKFGERLRLVHTPEPKIAPDDDTVKYCFIPSAALLAEMYSEPECSTAALSLRVSLLRLRFARFAKK